MTLALPRYPGHPNDPTLIVVSFDPGGTTGWAVHQAGINALEVGGWTFARQGHLSWDYGEFQDRSEWYMVDQMVQLVREAWSFLREGAGDLLAVVNEDFQLRQFSTDRNLLSPVRINSAFRYTMRGSGVPCFLQQPSDALFSITDERLRLWNLWQEHPGKTKKELDHRRDAQRHGIFFVRKFASDEKIRSIVRKAKVNAEFESE